MTSLVPFAAYEPPPIFLGAQRGRFYVTPPDPSLPPDVVAQQRRGHCRHGIPAMAAHETYPGHHLQLVTSQHLTSEVRRHLWTPVMVEGWALYWSSSMVEVGYYQTPEQRLFQLVNLLWRAIRIVLDVGLHTRGMTPKEAVDYMVEHLPIERRSAEAEVRRSSPGPPISCVTPSAGASCSGFAMPIARRRAASSSRGDSTMRCWRTGAYPSRSRAGGWTSPSRASTEEERP